MKTTRPASKPSAADVLAAAAEAKAGEEPSVFRAPKTRPAPGGSQTARPKSTPPAGARSIAREPRQGRGRRQAASTTLPAPGEHPNGGETP